MNNDVANTPENQPSQELQPATEPQPSQQATPVPRVSVATVNDFRRENLKRYATSQGGAGVIARKLGYANASFIVQMIGPNPSRQISEKTARKFEEALNLAHGHLDQPVDIVASLRLGSPNVHSNVQYARSEIGIVEGYKQVQRVVGLLQSINKVCVDNGVEISVPRFIGIVEHAMLKSIGTDWRMDTVELESMIL